MIQDVNEDRIRQRAHQLWEQDGRPDGNHDSHWQRATDELRQEDEGRQLENPQQSKISNAPGSSDGAGSGIDSFATTTGDKDKGVDGLS